MPLITNYRIYPVTKQTIAIPMDAKILSVGTERDKLHVSFMTDIANKQPGNRSLLFIPSGQMFPPIDPDKETKYIGSVTYSSIEFHLFEIINKIA